MKSSSLPSLLILSALAALPASADTLKLKNGKIFEGTVTERGDSYEVAIPMGKIIDYQTVKKADVAEFIKTQPDEKEAAEIAKLVPTADGTAAAEYERLLKDVIAPFLKKYPISKFKAQVDGVGKVLTEELARVKAGDVKLDGQWIPAADLKWNDYNIKALRLLLQMRAQLKAKKPMEAYQQFAQLEMLHAASTSYPKAVTEILKALPDLESTLDAAAADQPAKVIERTKMVAGLTQDKRPAVETAIREEEAAFKARLAEEKKNKVPIITFYPYDINSIKESLAGVKKEVTRLGALDLQKLSAVNAKFEAGLKDFSQKAFQSARSNFEEASKFHTKDAFVKKMLDDAKAGAENAAKNAGSTAVLPGSTPPPAPPVPAAGTPPPSGAGTPLPAATPKPAEPAKTAAGAPVKPPPAPAPAPDTSSAAAEAPPEEESSNLPLFLIGGAGLLLVSSLLVKFMGKKKSDD